MDGQGPGSIGGNVGGEPMTDAAVRALLELVGEAGAKLREGDGALADPQARLESYRWAFSVLSVAMDAYVWADPAAPHFVDIVGRTRKWGGDNSDAYYQYAPIDPSRSYLVRGRPGDAVYCSLTVYGGPDDGRYSERIVGTVNDATVTVGDDGWFGVWLSRSPPPEGSASTWLRLEDDAVCAVTRDYLLDPFRGERMQWRIEAVGDPGAPGLTDEALARRFRAAATWFRDQLNIVPVPLGEVNTVQEPYPVPQQTFGWAAGDAAYAMGSFRLASDEALVIRGSSPECRFWNLCLWNQLLHTFDYDRGQVTLNGGQLRPEPDGSWTIVVAETDPGHPNWLATQGHTEGLLWFRWFLPETTPSRPSTEVLPTSAVASRFPPPH